LTLKFYVDEEVADDYGQNQSYYSLVWASVGYAAHGDRSTVGSHRRLAQSTGAEWMGLKWVALDTSAALVSTLPKEACEVMVGVT